MDGKADYLSLQEVVTDPHMTTKDGLTELNAGQFLLAFELEQKSSKGEGRTEEWKQLEGAWQGG